jgi:hypothetical protein
MNISTAAYESFKKVHLDPKYLPRKIFNIKRPFLWLLIIKMESYKKEKIVTWSGKMLEDHLPQMYSENSFFWVKGDTSPSS